VKGIKRRVKSISNHNKAKGAEMISNKNSFMETQMLLKKGHPEFPQEVGVDFSFLLALSKKDAFEVSCLKFKKKYGMDYNNFIRLVERKKEESAFDMSYFEMKDDLMDWEFAEAARLWWIEKIDRIASQT
jgi:hypothetical protein